MDKSLTANLTSALPWAVIAKIVIAVTAIPTSVIVVRFLGGYDYGVYSILMRILSFLSVFLIFGFDRAILRYLPEFKIKKQYHNIKRLVARIAMIQSSLWFIVLLLFLLFGDLVGFWFRIDMKVYLLAGISVLLIITVFATLQQVLNSIYETKFITVNLLLKGCLLFTLTFIFLKIGLGIYGVFIASGICNLLVVLSFGWKLLKLPIFRPNPSRRIEQYSLDQRRILKYSLPIVGTGILNMIVWRQSETLFLGYFFSPVEAGYFNLGYQLPQQILEFIPLAVWPLILASFSEIYSKNPNNLVFALKAYYRLLFSMIVPISIIGVLLGDKALVILYGQNMAPAGFLCQVFFFLFSIFAIEAPLSMALYVIEKTWINLLILSFQAILNIALDLLIIPRYGLYGAIFPVALVLIIPPYFRYLIVKRYISTIKIPWKFIGKTYVASLPLLLLLPLRSYATGFLSFSVIIFIAIFLLTLSIRQTEMIEKHDLEILRNSNVPMKDFFVKIFIKENKKYAPTVLSK